MDVKKVLLKMVSFMLLVYLALVLAVFIGQRSLLYFPSKARPTENILRSLGLSFWPSASEYYGLMHGTSSAKGTIIIFHGNAGSAISRVFYSNALGRLGYRVILAEYPGYGGRPGSMGEAEFAADAAATIRRAHADFKSPIWVWGESLGAGVVASVAARPGLPVAGIVLITPWDTLSEVAKKHYWYLPAGQMLYDKFDSVSYMQSFDKPVAVILAGQDNIVPPEHGRRLYESITGVKRLIVFEQAGHNNWPSEPGNKWWGDVMQFLETGQK